MDHFFDSSIINTATWDRNRLWVTLKSGHSYLYYDVPYALYQDFIKTESAGKFYNARIKGKFSSVQIT